MSNINCRNIRRAIEEAGSADLLSAAALSHLESCAACEKLSRQQTRLQGIVAGLGTVEAPGDFEFRLRARLAGEKRAVARPLRLSFGLRSAAVAALLLLIGSLVAFVALKSGSNSQVAGGHQATPKPVTKDAGPKQIAVPGSVTPGSIEVAQAPTGNAPVRASDHTTRGRRVGNELASFRPAKLPGTQDSSGTRAPVLKRDQLTESYPTAAFPINASYQSLKVSVDDAHGTSRTISLPSVSFGSQRTLSQNASPLLASSRGSW